MRTRLAESKAFSVPQAGSSEAASQCTLSLDLTLFLYLTVIVTWEG